MAQSKKKNLYFLMCDNNPIVAAKEAENPSIKNKNLIYIHEFKLELLL